MNCTALPAHAMNHPADSLGHFPFSASEEETDASSTTAASNATSFSSGSEASSDIENRFNSENYNPSHAHKANGYLRESPIPTPLNAGNYNAPMRNSSPAPFTVLPSPMNTMYPQRPFHGQGMPSVDPYKSMAHGQPRPSQWNAPSPSFRQMGQFQEYHGYSEHNRSFHRGPALGGTENHFQEYKAHSEHTRSIHRNAGFGAFENQAPNGGNANDIYQALVVGSKPPLPGPMNATQNPAFHISQQGPQTAQPWNAADRMLTHSMSSHSRSTGSGQGPMPSMQLQQQQGMNLNNPSFQSVTSNLSRQVVYQAPNWEEEEPISAIRYRTVDSDDDTESGDRLGAFGVAPPVMPPHLAQKNRKKNVTTLARRGCGVGGMEGDFVGILTSMKDHFTVEEGDEGDDSTDDEDDREEKEEGTSLTKLSNDLRKQRLRNRVLENERDNVNQENTELRHQVKSKQTEIEELRKKVQDLEESRDKASAEVVSRDMKIATMMNEFLENKD